MYFDHKTKRYIQIATVEGAVRNCGDIDFPGIYVRLDHPSIFYFIEESTMPQSNGKY
jgi:hypothetical protein